MAIRPSDPHAEDSAQALVDRRTVTPRELAASDDLNDPVEAASAERSDVVAVQLRLDGTAGRELVESRGRLEYREPLNPPAVVEKPTPRSDAELLFAGAPEIGDGDPGPDTATVLDPAHLIEFTSELEACAHEACDAFLVWYQVGNLEKVGTCEDRVRRVIHQAVGLDPTWTRDELAAWCRLTLATGERLTTAA